MEGDTIDLFTWFLIVYAAVFHLPRFIIWLRYAKYPDDSFYENQRKGVNKLTDYM